MISMRLRTPMVAVAIEAGKGDERKQRQKMEKSTKETRNAIRWPPLNVTEMTQNNLSLCFFLCAANCRFQILGDVQVQNLFHVDEMSTLEVDRTNVWGSRGGCFHFISGILGMVIRSVHH